MQGPSIQGYDDLTPLGRGGFATVYRATQVALHRAVAVKVLDVVGTDERMAEQFTRECRAVGGLSGHPHIVPVHDAGRTDDGRPYLAMELCEGGSLSDVVDRGPLPPADAARLGRDIADALAAAHELGVLHRDIKPANLLIDRRGGVRLADFGIARLQGVDPTTTSAVTGSLPYLAPELLQGGRASEASDIYALGMTVVVLALGHHPFVRSTDEAPFAVLQRAMTEPLPDLRAHGVPSELAALLAACCAKDPKDRPASAVVVRDALAARAEAVVGPTLPAPLPRDPTPVPRSARTRSRWTPAEVVACVVTMVLVALAAAGVGLGLIRGGASDDEAAPARVTADEERDTDEGDGPDVDAPDVDTVVPGTLTVCASSGAPPFSSVGSGGGSPVGLEIDLVTAVADGLGLDVAFDIDGPPFVDAFADDLCDIGVGAVTITSERDEFLDFSDGFLDASPNILVRRGAGLAADDLPDVDVGVVEGSTGEARAVDELGVVSPVLFPAPEDAVDALLAGEVDAVVQDGPLNVHWSAEHDELEIVELPSNGDELGLVMAEGAGDLRLAVNDQLDRLRDDGTLDDLVADHIA